MGFKFGALSRALLWSNLLSSNLLIDVNLDIQPHLKLFTKSAVDPPARPLVSALAKSWLTLSTSYKLFL
jgi:hypothetical protein